MNKNFSQKIRTMELLDKIQKEFNFDSKVIIKNNMQESNANDNMKNEKDSNTNEILVPVKAKPQLFGPETNVYDYQDADLEKDIFG